MFDLLFFLKTKRERVELEDAKKATTAGEERGKALVQELKKLEEENHIVARVHAAFRGE